MAEKRLRNFCSNDGGPLMSGGVGISGPNRAAGVLNGQVGFLWAEGTQPPVAGSK